MQHINLVQWQFWLLSQFGYNARCHTGFEKENERDKSYGEQAYDYDDNQARSWGFCKGVRIDSNIYQEGLLNTSAEGASL